MSKKNKSTNPVESFTFGTENCDLEQRESKRIKKAKSLGWSDIHFVYDDMVGGLYLGGLDKNGKFGKVPELKDM